MSNLYIDVHVLQTVPPSNLNRDDAGSPKQAQYGGVRRARVSSQAWKRATRKMFAETIPTEQQATRTRLVDKMLIEPLVERNVDRETAGNLAQATLESLGLTVKEPKKKQESDEDGGNGRGPETEYLLFLGRHQRDQIADVLAERAEELAALDDSALKKELKGTGVRDMLSRGHPLDVALFGRMVADLTALNVDAAVQVAHAISTHPVEIEFDYFTAVDDEKAQDPEAEDVGAGMIGTVEFNSATLYRYATVGVGQLIENLDGSVAQAADAVRQFIEGFVRSMPTGHQNSFAHRTLPSAVAVAVRDDQPVNLASAFEEPVRSTDGVMRRSLVKLAEEQLKVQTRWASKPVLVAATYEPDSDEATEQEKAFGPSRPFADVLASVRQLVAEQPERASAGQAV